MWAVTEDITEGYADANTLMVANGSGGTIPTVVSVNPTTGAITGASMPGFDGTVTNVSSANSDLSVATPTTTPVITLASVGGVSAANVAAGANLANAATDANTVSTIVKRDASGNFSAGTITSATGVTATTGAITATNGNFVLGTAGNKIVYTEGANGVSGSGTLVSGTVTIACTSVTANSRFSVVVTDKNASTALGVLQVTKNAGVGFTVTSLNVTDGTTVTGDVSTFDYSFTG